MSRMSLSLFSSISTISIFPLRFLFTTVDKLSTHCSSAARLTIVPCSTKKHVSLDRESAPRKSSSRRVDAMHDSVSRTLPRHVPLIDVFIRNNSIKLNRMFQKSRRPLASIARVCLRGMRHFWTEISRVIFTVNRIISTDSTDGIGGIRRRLAMSKTTRKENWYRGNNVRRYSRVQGVKCVHPRGISVRGLVVTFDFSRCSVLIYLSFIEHSWSIQDAPMQPGRSAHEKWQLRQKRIVYPRPQPRFRIIDT